MFENRRDGFLNKKYEKMIRIASSQKPNFRLTSSAAYAINAEFKFFINFFNEYKGKPTIDNFKKVYKKRKITPSLYSVTKIVKQKVLSNLQPKVYNWRIVYDIMKEVDPIDLWVEEVSKKVKSIIFFSRSTPYSRVWGQCDGTNKYVCAFKSLLDEPDGALELKDHLITNYLFEDRKDHLDRFEGDFFSKYYKHEDYV